MDATSTGIRIKVDPYSLVLAMGLITPGEDDGQDEGVDLDTLFTQEEKEEDM